MLMLGAIKMGMRLACEAICAFCAAEKPVVPTTSATPLAAQTSAWWSEASALVKSMSTSAGARASASSIEPTIGTSSGPAPVRSPASRPMCGPPGRSVAPTTIRSSSARAALRIREPIRPRTPATTTRIGWLMGPSRRRRPRRRPSLRPRGSTGRAAGAARWPGGPAFPSAYFDRHRVVSQNSARISGAKRTWAAAAASSLPAKKESQRVGEVGGDQVADHRDDAVSARGRAWAR